MNADIIKIKLIDFLISNNDDVIIGNEVMFGFHKNIADIIQLYKNNSYAFEVKGDNDDFRRLTNQIFHYLEVFDYLYIVITLKHLTSCTKLDERIGIILVDNDDVLIYKKAKKNETINKREILETVNANYLKDYFNIKGKRTSAEIRSSLMNKGVKPIKQLLYDYLKKILAPKFRIFINEKNHNTHIEDLRLLSLLNKIII